MASSSTQMLMHRPYEVNAQKKQVNEDAGVLTQQTSLELVQILLLVTISSILYLRAPFGAECFKTALYDEQMTYKAFKSQKNDLSIKDIREANQKSLRAFEVLSRGANNQIDQVLDWIELGLADALEKKYLESAQLAFFHQVVNTDSVIEVYTMSFEYREEGGVEITTIARSLESQGIHSESQGVSVNLARDQVRGTVARLVAVMQALDDLPEDDLVFTMQLNYNEHRPERYQPPGFKESGVEATLPMQTGVSMGTVLTGYYNVGLKYSVENKQASLNFRLDDYNTNNHPHLTSAHSNLKPDTNNSSTEDQFVMPPRTRGGKKYPHSPNSATRYNTYGEIPASHGDIWKDPLEYLNGCNNAHNHVYDNGRHSDEAKQMKQDGLIPEVARLRKLDPAYKHQHTTPATSPKRGKKNGELRIQLSQSKEENEDLRREKIDLEALRDMALSRNDFWDTQIIDDEGDVALKRFKPQLIKSLRRAAKFFSEQDEYAARAALNIVKCQCGSDKSPDFLKPTLLMCKICATLQHRQCYGYFGRLDDSNISDVHICYECILFKLSDEQDESQVSTNKILYTEMEEICKARFSLFFLYQQEMDLEEDQLATLFTYPDIDPMKMELRLVREGYLKPQANPPASLSSRTVGGNQALRLFKFYYNPEFQFERFFVPGHIEGGRLTVLSEEKVEGEDDGIGGEKGDAEVHEQLSPFTSPQTNLQAGFLNRIARNNGHSSASGFSPSVNAPLSAPAPTTSVVMNIPNASTGGMPFPHGHNSQAFGDGSSTQGSPSPSQLQWQIRDRTPAPVNSLKRSHVPDPANDDFSNPRADGFIPQYLQRSTGLPPFKKRK